MNRVACVMALGLAMLGCSGDKASAPPTGAAGCAMVGEKIWGLLELKAKHGAPDALAALAPHKAHALPALAAPCSRDAWPAATLTCFEQLAPGTDFKVCSDGLATDARKNLKSAVAAVEQMIGSGSAH